MSRIAVTVVFLLVAQLTSGHAAMIDWSTLSWTPGSLSNSYDVDPGPAGNDVTVTVSGDVGQLQPSLVAPNPQTPAITQAFAGGQPSAHPTLELALNLANNTQSVTVTISFLNVYAAGVSNVSFNLFDIDYANSGGNTYQDVISSISATSTTGTTIAPTITNVGGNAMLSGLGVNQTLTGMASTADTGPGSDLGNATISFDTTDIASITFTYSSGSAFADPTYQHIGIDNISFVPEPGNWYAGIFGCGVAVASGAVSYVQQRRRRNLPIV
jgi:hypothetical protein